MQVGSLLPLPGVEQGEATDPTLVLVDTAGCSMEELTTTDGISKCNPGEASVVVGHINNLVKAGIKVEDIAVVTPYNLQVFTVTCLVHLLQNFLCRWNY